MDTHLSVVPGDLDPDRLLPPGMRRKLNEVRGDYLADRAPLASEVVVAQAAVAAPAARLNSAVRALHEALAQRAAFGARAGAQAVGPSAVARGAMWLLLAFLAISETAFAFNGVRYGLGQYGQIHRVWEDPLSLVGAVAIAALSLALAHAAGTSLSWGERSLLQDPEQEPAELDDECPSPGVDVGPSAHVFHLTRPRAVYRRVGWLLVAGGIALWTVNGVMRVRYLDRLPGPTTGQYGGALAPQASSGSSGSDARTTGALIIALSVMAFAGSVIVVNRTHTAVYLRARDLDKQVKDAEALADAEQAIAEGPLRRVVEAEAALHRRASSALVAADDARTPHIAL
jgi:hypothetical protein